MLREGNIYELPASELRKSDARRAHDDVAAFAASDPEPGDMREVVGWATDNVDSIRAALGQAIVDLGLTGRVGRSIKAADKPRVYIDWKG